MYGPEDQKDSMDIDSMGIILQSGAYIFEILNNKNHHLVEGMLSYQVYCEFVEIYNENLKDLLDLSNKPQLKNICINAQNDEWRVHIKGIQRRQVRNLGELLKAVRIASANRTVAGTNLNATSSRSHMVLRLIVKIETSDGIRTGIGNFSDLAGSEKVKKTGADGQRLKEAQNILLSLSTLSRVITSLVKRENPAFRDSKLTFMLKDSLGGNCKTALLIAASPHVFNRDETVRSLQFGERCRKIQNKARINAVRTKAQLVKENENLKAQIEKLKRQSHEFVMIEDEKSVEKEKQRLNVRISGLEQANQALSDQIQEFHLRKEQDDMENARESAKLSNENEELLHAVKEYKLDLIDKNQMIVTKTKQLTDLQCKNEELMTARDALAQESKNVRETNAKLLHEIERLLKQNEQRLNEINKLKSEYERSKQQEIEIQSKWKRELDSKKLNFSKQEMELTQNIETRSFTKINEK